MLIATKPLSIGDHVVARGERLSAEVQEILPPGRVEALKRARMVEEITDETAIARVVDELVSRVEVLEKRLDARRGPGRPRKSEES